MKRHLLLRGIGRVQNVELANLTIGPRCFGISGRAYVREIDVVLHCQRLGQGRAKRFHIARLGDLPDGAFVLVDNQPCLVADDSLWRWHVGGYQPIHPLRLDTMATLITPPSLVQVMKAGYRPQTALKQGLRVASEDATARLNSA